MVLRTLVVQIIAKSVTSVTSTAAATDYNWTTVFTLYCYWTTDFAAPMNVRNISYPTPYGQGPWWPSWRYYQANLEQTPQSDHNKGV